MKPLEISSTADAIASDSDEVHLVAEEFGTPGSWEFASAIFLKVRKLSAPMNLRVQILTVVALHASCRVDPYPDNGQIREGHLRQFMSGCRGYK